MKIGIDGKWFFDGPPSNREVTQNLVQQLAVLNEDNEIYIFLNKRHKKFEFPFKRQKVRVVYVWAGINLISNVFVLPVWSFYLDLDVVLFQNFAPPLSTCKRIVYIHDVIFKTHPKYFTFCERLYFFPVKFLARRAHAIITVSESEKRRIAEHRFGNPERIFVALHGVNERFKPRENHDQSYLRGIKNKYNLPERYLLYTGRFNERKNLRNLLNAVAQLQDQSIPLVMVGKEDWKMFDLDKVARDYAVESRVKRLGFVPTEDIAGVYALSTIFCYVSFEEGFGMPPLEAMASGIPVVVADSASLAEVCSNAGIYVDPRRPGDIAKAIDVVLSDEGTYKQKRLASIERARQFSWQCAARTVMGTLIQYGQQ